MRFTRARALVVVGGLFAVAAVCVITALALDSQSGNAAGCPKGAVLVNAGLPDDNKNIKIRIFNGTSQPGLAQRVGEDFSHRGFSVDKERANSPKAVDQIAVLRYGPKTVGAAWLLRAYFYNELGHNDVQFDPQRPDDVVDVVIGKEFLGLAKDTEVKQSFAALGKPIPPANTCPAPPAPGSPPGADAGRQPPSTPG